MSARGESDPKECRESFDFRGRAENVSLFHTNVGIHNNVPGSARANLICRALTDEGKNSNTKWHKRLQDAKASHSICLINILPRPPSYSCIRLLSPGLPAFTAIDPKVPSRISLFLLRSSASGCCEACRKDPRLHDSPMNGQQATCWGPLLSTPRAQHHVRPSSWNHSRA